MPRISQTAFTFLRKRSDVFVGTSLVLHNPLVRAERLVMRAIQEAQAASDPASWPKGPLH